MKRFNEMVEYPHLISKRRYPLFLIGDLTPQSITLFLIAPHGGDSLVSLSNYLLNLGDRDLKRSRTTDLSWLLGAYSEEN